MTAEVPSRRFRYDYRQFWRFPPSGACGPWDPLNPTSSPAHNAQEQAIIGILNENNVEFDKIKSIFEIGCGFGRIARFCAQNFPNANYTAVDLNPKAIDSARTFQPNGDFLISDFLELNVPGFYDDPAFQGYDLVIASEVLMHIPPRYVRIAAQRALELVNPEGGHLLTADWVPSTNDRIALRRREYIKRGSGIAPWNFIHAYGKVFQPYGTMLADWTVGNQKVYLVKP